MADTDTTTEVTAEDTDDGRPTVEELWDVVRLIQDPELRMSIVDLGLVYHVDIDDEGLVTIDLTLTSPGCPVGPMIRPLSRNPRASPLLAKPSISLTRTTTSSARSTSSPARCRH